MRSVTTVLIGVLLIVLVVAGVLLYRRDGGTSLWDTMRSVKETSQNAATTSKVKTALMLSKHVSAFDVGVATNQGAVTLTGEVPSQEIRRLVVAITQDTSGVTQVHDDLTINPGAGRNKDTENLADRVADLEIKTIVIDELARSPELKDKRFTVQVSKRTVTLDGAVDSPAQKRLAEQIVLQVPGVQGLAGNLSLANAPASPETADDKLARRVEFELYSTRAVPLKNVQIRAQDATVILTGGVATRAEKLLAERVTQSVEGVKRVVNNLNAPEEGSR